VCVRERERGSRTNTGRRGMLRLWARPVVRHWKMTEREVSTQKQ
jgi:hypothetical protein